MAPTAQSNATNNSAVPEPLNSAIVKTFGNLTAFEAQLTAAALGVFGSGAHAGMPASCSASKSTLSSASLSMQLSLIGSRMQAIRHGQHSLLCFGGVASLSRVFACVLCQRQSAELAAGWAWLTVNPKNGSLTIETTPNQDSTLSTGLGYSGNIPILGLDVVRRD
jgi:superoxide dismutase